MVKDYSKEIKNKINKLMNKGFDFGKSDKYLEHRTGKSFKEIIREIKDCKFLEFTEKRIIEGEERFTLYFVYNKRKGMAYAITFRKKIRIITAFPLGRRTLSKYNRKRFKKSKNI